MPCLYFLSRIVLHVSFKPQLNSLFYYEELSNIISLLPVFTPDGTIGLPSVRPSVRLSVCQSVSPSVCPLKYWSFDNLKTIKARQMKHGTWIGSNVYNMHAHHLGRYLEGQDHGMTLKQNCVRPITLLFEVGFYNYLTEMITILRWCVTIPCPLVGSVRTIQHYTK